MRDMLPIVIIICIGFFAIGVACGISYKENKIMERVQNMGYILYDGVSNRMIINEKVFIVNSVDQKMPLKDFVFYILNGRMEK